MNTARYWMSGLLMFALGCDSPSGPTSRSDAPPVIAHDRIVHGGGLSQDFIEVREDVLLNDGDELQFTVRNAGEDFATEELAVSPAHGADVLAPLPRAVQFLLKQQDNDGGFKSQTYGALKGGAATTALVLYAVSHAPGEVIAPHRRQWQQACDFLQPGIAKTGSVACPDGSLDYPIYGSAIVARCGPSSAP